MDIDKLNIKNLVFTSEDTGLIFSKTYTEYIWKFTLDDIDRIIKLEHSKIFGTRIIYLGIIRLCRYQKYTYNFYFSFPLDVHTISINQNGDSYILKIDNIPFNSILNEQKLRRFDIIREAFRDMTTNLKHKKKSNKIKTFRTFNKTGGLPITGRDEDINKRVKYVKKIMTNM